MCLWQGCKIELFDETLYQSYLETAAPWMKNIAAQYGGNPYAKLVEMGKLAENRVLSRGFCCIRESQIRATTLDQKSQSRRR